MHSDTSNEPVGVRLAVPADASLCSSLLLEQMVERIQRVAPETLSQILSNLDRSKMLLSWQEAISQEDGEVVLVATEGQKIVGFAAFLPVVQEENQPSSGNGDDNLAEITVFVVDAKAVGRGHGSRLLQALADHAKEKYSSLQIWIAKDDRNRVRFFQEAGFGPLPVSRELQIGQKRDAENLWATRLAE
ncbi:GNAT family N-acetyltransferase [Actinomycetaceae bacterium TAE3-ERU4]|nr:GNAT family N-acetyltransferase [Actinomycetaceae bacterium TAE3-ERU4]